MTRIDLNSDLGESFGRYTIGNDDQVLDLITAANVACGFHAGDPNVMAQTVALAEAIPLLKHLSCHQKPLHNRSQLQKPLNLKPIQKK